jgi:hypothetical protein
VCRFRVPGQGIAARSLMSESSLSCPLRHILHNPCTCTRDQTCTTRLTPFPALSRLLVFLMGHYWPGKTTFAQRCAWDNQCSVMVNALLLLALLILVWSRCQWWTRGRPLPFIAFPKEVYSFFFRFLGQKLNFCSFRSVRRSWSNTTVSKSFGLLG